MQSTCNFKFKNVIASHLFSVILSNNYKFYYSFNITLLNYILPIGITTGLTKGTMKMTLERQLQNQKS